jgi:hypothetical protein
MTDQRQLDNLLGAFLAEGPEEVADRVIDAALDQIDYTRQRSALRLPWRFQSTPMLTRLAAAAFVGVLAVGGAIYLIQPGKPAVAGPRPTPAVSHSPSVPTPTPLPTQFVPTAAPTGPMGAGRQAHTATLLADGRVLIVGGYDSKSDALASAELYDPRTNAFIPTGTLATARGLHTATLLADGRVLIAGGGPAGWAVSVPYLASAELYDPKTGRFSPTGSMATAREGHTATLLADGRVLIVGGNDVGDHGVASAELYDPRTGTFSPTGSMATARGFHTATLLADGRVLIAGGDPAAWNNGGPFLSSAELYDPKTGRFTATGPMTVGRELHAATLLPNGRVLITGGVTNSGAVPSLASAEIYDPKTGRFTATGLMTIGRVYHTATLLSDGRVLVAGGMAHGRVYANNYPFLASAELYDPKTGRFTPTGPMADTRAWFGASLLSDGRVLITAGAIDSGVTTLASAELYSPETGTFSPAGQGS